MSAGKQILVADDDAAGRELLAEILRAAGYAVQEASDGHEAIRSLRQNPPDLAILDIEMPMCDGFAVLHFLHHQLPPPWPPVVALTAHALVGDHQHALTLGFDDYLTKPVDIQRLRSRIGELLKPAAASGVSIP